jgi:GTP-binding protein
VKNTDRNLLQLLRENSIPHQIILSKVDTVLFGKGGTEENLVRLKAQMEETLQIAQGDPDDRLGPGPLGEIICVSGIGLPGGKRTVYSEGLGIANLRWAILTAAGVQEGLSKRKQKKVPYTGPVTGESGIP